MSFPCLLELISADSNGSSSADRICIFTSADGMLASESPISSLSQTCLLSTHSIILLSVFGLAAYSFMEHAIGLDCMIVNEPVLTIGPSLAGGE